MKKIVILVIAGIISTTSLNAVDIKGSGASFPYSVYQKWLKEYNSQKGIKVEYIKKGSSKGIKDIKARVVNFAGTDKPLSTKVLTENALYQFPSVVGAIVMGYNIPGKNNIKLSREVIAQIAMGNIIYWDNKLIADKNKDMKLPHEKLTFIHRSDGSGTTYNFTYYLSQSSQDWANKYGTKKSLSWPGDHHIGGNKNSGVATLIKQTPYSIGYIDYTDAANNSISMATIENKEGFYIKPELKAFKASVAQANLDPKKDFYSIIADPKGKDSYSMVAATFILLPKEKTQMNKKVTAFYNWSYKNGQEIAKSLGFVPLPDLLTNKIRKYWEEKGIK